MAVSPFSKFVNEPVRAYLYSALVPLLALLVTLGVISSGLVVPILAVASGVLAVGGIVGVEKARSVVTPVLGAGAPPEE